MNPEFSSRERALIMALLSFGPGGAAPKLICDKMYSDEDGGPLSAMSGVSVTRVNINKKLAPHGLTIVSEKILNEPLNWHQRLKRSTEIYRPEEEGPNWRGKHPSRRWRFTYLALNDSREVGERKVTDDVEQTRGSLPQSPTEETTSHEETLTNGGSPLGAVQCS